MIFESPKFEPPKLESLSEEETHDEANMLRAKMEASPETGKIGDFFFMKAESQLLKIMTMPSSR